MLAEPERVTRLQARGGRFLRAAREQGIDTGGSVGMAVVPAICGSSLRAARLSEVMFACGVNVQPILYPAVEEKSARLRFFVCADHTDDDIDRVVAVLAEELRRL
jgi:7-keto-8-aminopelargonate synthetase-like enzyme